MKAVGEVMAIGKTVKETFQKAIRGLENGRAGLTIPNLIKLHEALDTPISSFFEDIEGKPVEEKKSEVTLEDLTELLRLLKAGKN